MKSFNSVLFNKIQDYLIFMHYSKRKVGEYVKLFEKRNLIKKIQLTKEEKLAIDTLWGGNYGKKIPYYWHKLYASYTGVVDINYFPEVYYSTNLERLQNDYNVALAMEDKSQFDIFLRLPGESKSCTVGTILSKVQNVVYSGTHEIINQGKILEYVYNLGKCVIKPSIDSDSGRGVRILDIQNGIDVKSNQNIEDILKSYKTDFLIQDFINIHKAVQELNPSSVNTIRIITYLCHGKIYHAPLTMRIGVGNVEVDNIHAGGLFIGLQDDGQLKQYAFSEYGEKTPVHPFTGLVFLGHMIPGVEKSIHLVERAHKLIPRLSFISWDVTILADGNPIIVEMNTRNQAAWLPQMANGISMFGENTPDMIRMLKNKH